MNGKIRVGSVVEVVGLGREWEGLQFRVTIRPYGDDLIRGVVTRPGSDYVSIRRYPPGHEVTFYDFDVKLACGFGAWYRRYS